MEPIGAQLKQARENLGIGIDKASRDTFITRDYLVAMEEENFDVIPGESYLVGFLKTYSRYLDLDSERISKLYRNTKLQEQPTPTNELIIKKKKKALPITISLVVFVALAAFGIYFFFLRNDGVQETQPVVIEADEPAGNFYALSDEVIEQVFAEKDTISVAINNTDVEIGIVKIDSAGVIIASPAGEFRLGTNEQMLIDIIGDGKADLKVVLRAIGGTDTRREAVLRFDKAVSSPNTSGTLHVPEKVVDEFALPVLPAVGMTVEESRKREVEVILQSAKMETVNFEVSFRADCLLRSRIDDKEIKESYFRRGDFYRDNLELSAQLWFSNSGAASVRIAGLDIDFGNLGEVRVYRIQWAPANTSGMFNLEMVPVY
jgi:cytoskeletal protein RodZ